MLSDSIYHLLTITCGVFIICSLQLLLVFIIIINNEFYHDSSLNKTSRPVLSAPSIHLLVFDSTNFTPANLISAVSVKGSFILHRSMS